MAGSWNTLLEMSTKETRMRAMAALGCGLAALSFLFTGCASTTSGIPTADPNTSTIQVVTASAAPTPTITPATAPSLDRLLTAPVPALCDHPPGELVDGSLPGLPENRGVVELAGYADGHWADVPLADAWVGGDGHAYAASVINCNQGGVSWPQRVVLYGGKMEVLEAFDLADIIGDGRQSVGAMSREGDVLSLEVRNTYQDGDSGCCGTKDALVEIDITQDSATARVAKEFTERQTADAAFAALLAGDQSALGTLFTPKGLAISQAQIADVRDLAWSKIATCTSASETPESFTQLITEEFSRTCGIGTADGSWGATIAMSSTGFGQWISVGVETGRPEI